MTGRIRRRRIGMTTTVPLEPFLAADVIPVDLNNLFISSLDPNREVEEAQVRGYPRNICTWIKGLYTASREVDGVVGVVRGDCSNTESLLSTLEREGISTHPFSYPFVKDLHLLEEEIGSLCDYLGTTLDKSGEMAGRVRELRDLALELDEIAWKEGGLHAHDVHLALVSVSDLNSDPERWENDVRALIDGPRDPSMETEGPRIGYIGVPPIITDLFTAVEKAGARVLFFEVQRQFAMPSRAGKWMEDYLEYTYPYDISGRVRDIRQEAGRRRLDGIIHYVQSFCHRQIDDIIFRKELDLPILTIEGNLPGPIDERNLIRLEAFLDVLDQGGVM